MHPKQLLELILEDLADLKAININPLDVSNFTSITDYMVIATGNSSRHVKSIRDNLVKKMKSRKLISSHIESDADDEWVLVDLGDVVVHIMQPRVRDFYNLEKLWAVSEAPQAEPAFA